MLEYNNTEELYHYGILGMKWGHRKARYPKSEDRIRYEELKKKKVSQLSTKELNELNNRMQAESNYKRNKKDRNAFNKAVKIAVATGLTVEALYKTYGMLKRVSKDSKPIVDKIKQKTKSIKHSDIKTSDDFKNYVKTVANNQDYLMHYGVLGMKWKYHKNRLAEYDKKYEKESNKILSRTSNMNSVNRQLTQLDNRLNKEYQDSINYKKKRDKRIKYAKAIGTTAAAAAGAYALGKYLKKKGIKFETESSRKSREWAKESKRLDDLIKTSNKNIEKFSDEFITKENLDKLSSLRKLKDRKE